MSGFGCMIGHKYYGATGYAGYISLIAPSIYALNGMRYLSRICIIMLSRLAFHGSGSHVTSFNYILSQFKLDATTFCNMNTNYFL